MRRYLMLVTVSAFLLFALAAMAQTSSAPRHTTTTTTTTSQQTSTVSGTEHVVEGCVMKEASDFFLIPSRGNPIELQPSAGQDLTAHEGHKVKVRGVESALSASTDAGNGGIGGAAGMATTTTTTTTAGQSRTHSVNEPAGTNTSSNAGAASGTGNDLHRLATKQITVANLDHVADTCPVNWNPRMSGKR